MKNVATNVTNILIITTLLSGAALASIFVSADDVVDEINITVPVSCSMSGTGMTSHNAEITNGTYQANIGTTTLHAFCNDAEGFAIYAAGYTGDEVGGTNSNKLVGTTASGNSAIESGIATSAGNPDVSNWAMKLAMTQDSGDTSGANAFAIDSAPNVSGGSDASFDQYHVVPNKYTKVAHKNSGTDMMAMTGGVKLTTTYAAYISKTQPAETYSGQVIYILVHPSTALVPGACNPSGTTIGTNTSTDIVCMQDISSTNKSSILSSMTSEQQYTLIDKRDSKSYTISKLADGNIWMTQNLDLDLDSNKTYTNLDTDLGWNGTSYSIASWTPARSTYDSNTKTWCQGGTWNSQYNYCQNNYTPESYDPGNLYWNETLSNYSNWSTYYNSCTWDSTTHEPACDESLNPIATYITVSGTPTQQYHLGNFYNWNAAIASNNSSSITGGIVEQSICPAGWTLPIGDCYSVSAAPDKSFWNLVEQYGWDDDDRALGNGQKIWESPIYLGLSGFWYGRLGNVGSDVFSWSSVAYGDKDVYSLVADSDDYVGPDYSEDRVRGDVVRCVAR
ncbi:hypothetical protein IKD98_00245 [Candidatus Saccharibacteria bacterium]|nr:hypothetical protein [Candidatus Saccharibacteria bacterium]